MLGRVLAADTAAGSLKLYHATGFALMGLAPAAILSQVRGREDVVVIGKARLEIYIYKRYIYGKGKRECMYVLTEREWKRVYV